MNNTQLDPGLSAMLASTNLSIDPGALLQQQQNQYQQQPLFEGDTSSSRTTSTSSVPRLSTPNTEDDEDDLDEEAEEDDTSKKPNTRSKTKMPAASTRSKTTNATTSSSKSKRGGAGAAVGAADKRRKRNLERNRAAASKCRQRKKQWQDGLERKKMELETRYKALHGEAKDLMEEVAQLKNFVMAHAACNDANIDDWIRNEADNFVRRMSGAHMHQASQSASAAASMGQMRSPTQSVLTATPPMNDSLNAMFAPGGSKAPFDRAPHTQQPDLRSGGATDTSDQNSNIFNQDLLMLSSM
ncbi:Cyclic AMP-dependent transcription factor ATF-7 [Beauveria bassiana]|nr:Cyclic AMP-dependent transcription factor ATF-7 [Beauveria bassiana]KAH8719629.1 Cyclic AMP-dependent transcription factor ATF-7 [Beauveria bassiana]